MHPNLIDDTVSALDEIMLCVEIQDAKRIAQSILKRLVAEMGASTEEQNEAWRNKNDHLYRG